MVSHFTDNALGKEIQKYGFAVIPFASTSDLNSIRKEYESLPLNRGKGTQVTMFNPSEQYRKKVDASIKFIFGKKACDILQNYRVLYTNFMIKEPGAEGHFPVHQDWTYVDERFFSSYAIWVPMQDVNDKNGALHVVQYSHRLNTGLRGPGVFEPVQHLSEEIKSKYSKVVNLKAGEALIWDHRLIHFSLPNFSSQARLAFTLIMVPCGAEVIHCIAKQHDRFDDIDVYSVNEEFYMKYQIGIPPLGVMPRETIRQTREQYSSQQIREILV